MNKYILLIIISVMIILNGCSKEKTKPTITYRAISEKCGLIDTMEKSVDYLTIHPGEIVKQWGNDEECFDKFTDSVTSLFIATSNIKYIVCIDSMMRHSDGCIAEGFNLVTERMYKENFLDYFNYIYAKGEDSTNLMRSFFIWTLYYDIDEYSDLKGLTGSFYKKLNDNNYSTQHKRFLKNIIDEAIKQFEKDKQ